MWNKYLSCIDPVCFQTYAKTEGTSAEETPRSDGEDIDTNTVSGGTVNLTSLDDTDEEEDDNQAEESADEGKSDFL